MIVMLDIDGVPTPQTVRSEDTFSALLLLQKMLRALLSAREVQL